MCVCVQCADRLHACTPLFILLSFSGSSFFGADDDMASGELVTSFLCKSKFY